MTLLIYFYASHNLWVK